MLIRMLNRCAQGGAVDRVTGRKQRLATRQGELSFKVFEVKSMIFHYKLSHKILTEAKNLGSIFRAILPKANKQRCFASLNMTTLLTG